MLVHQNNYFLNNVVEGKKMEFALSDQYLYTCLRGTHIYTVLLDRDRQTLIFSIHTNNQTFYIHNTYTHTRTHTHTECATVSV